ncbi:2-amino-4-oxopentanoate thiolase subunit OrtB [Aminipila luticellarii]|uniref:PLP-dependent lyase/thiolase n=1 Tax=Aminipila luticellarii TaxID=2507160 RepID=A0A410PWH2_9FIRM|nr:2-amino-4-oxopentanoate thiolase subunit OrtB [Aminipila luticellarii]QAT43265.1 PLP-dependent lyase/thiolase [Aminipila luticellarii]
MKNDKTYEAIMARKNEIIKNAMQIDYTKFELPGIGFDYEAMMREVGYSLEEMREIQLAHGVGNTPLIELRNLTALARKYAPKGKGARIVVKDEAANASGSFKARRAAVAVYHAKKLGYKGVIAATSGNYGAAVASQAAMQGLKCIVVQECYDNNKVGQPEILEKQRVCEAYGAEVVQLSVGPELFSTHLSLLEETGYFNASLYTPFGIAGVETLGYELAEQCREKFGKDPEAVVCTNAGGGNLTGTARGLIKAGAENTRVIGACIDLKGLHMASEQDFNRKSCTTGHTGFSLPFTTWPDRSDCPRNAARVLRYMDEMVTIKQGELFYMTQALAILEGYERGPAGNTSLTAAFALAQQMDEDAILVVQETEYTSAGKHPMPQLTFAKKNGVQVLFGDPEDEIPGKNLVFPKDPSFIKARQYDMTHARKSYIKNCVKNCGMTSATEEDVSFIMDEIKSDKEFVLSELEAKGVKVQ